jgi:hypothetical protein
MYRKMSERKQSVNQVRWWSGIYLEGQRKIREMSVNIAIVLAESWNVGSGELRVVTGTQICLGIWHRVT